LEEIILKLIVAMDNNRVIGHNNQIPWSLPNDLQHVKRITIGGTLIMGRKNYESIGRSLPGRQTIVLTRGNSEIVSKDKNYITAGTLKDVLDLCACRDNVFVFGGEQLYRLFMPYVDTMYITRIHHEFNGDTYFPQVDMSQWGMVSKEVGTVDEKNIYPHTFYAYKRIINK
jgi:dihydrofolate reductase